jgi:hypothetical protein
MTVLKAMKALHNLPSAYATTLYVSDTKKQENVTILKTNGKLQTPTTEWIIHTHYRKQPTTPSKIRYL